MAFGGHDLFLEIGLEKEFVYHGLGGKVQKSGRILKNSHWYQIALVHHYLKKETQIFVDGQQVTVVKEQLMPLHFILGGTGEIGTKVGPAEADYMDWMVYRSALNADEANSLTKGVFIQSSLELYAPLHEKIEKNQLLENRAQSLARAYAFPISWVEDKTKLADKVKADEKNEKIFIDPEEKKPISVDPAIFVRYLGDYELMPGMILSITREGDRLMVLINGGKEGKSELFPLSDHLFFMRAVGSDIEIRFSEDSSQKAESLVFTVNGREMKGQRKK